MLTGSAWMGVLRLLWVLRLLLLGSLLSHALIVSAAPTSPSRSVDQVNQALLQAAARGDVQQVQHLLGEGADVNASSPGGGARSVLMLASAGGHSACVDALLAAGARIEARDRNGFTALNWAAMRGQPAAAKALLQHHAQVNTLNDVGVSPLLFAVGTRNRELVALLVTAGADLEVEASANKMTPLLLAIENDDDATTVLLLDAGAQVDGSNNDRFSPLMAAAQKGHNNTVGLLLKRGAAIELSDHKGLTALHHAVGGRHIDTVQQLLAGGANPSAADHRGRTVLMWAAMLNNPQTLSLLLAGGAAIDGTDRQGMTALMLAAATGRVASVERLLASDADTTLKNGAGLTALAMAEEAQHEDVVALLDAR